MFRWFWPRQEEPPEGALRKLGWGESLFIGFSKIFKGGHLKFTLFMKTKVDITHETMYKALVQAARRHPLLKSRISYKDGKYYYVPMLNWESNLELETTVSDDWQEASAKGFRRGFNDEIGPLWHAYLVEITRKGQQDDDSADAKHPETKSYALVLMFNHAIIDGKSAAVVLNDIVQSLNSIIDNVHNYSAEEELKVAPPLENALLPGVRPGIWDYVKIFKFLRQFLSAAKNPYTELYPARILREPDVDNDITKIIDFSVPIDPLLQRCRAEKVTIQAAVTAASCLAMLDLLRKKAPETERLPAPSSYVVDFRRFCEPVIEPQFMGFYAISNTMPPLNVTGSVTDSKAFWDIAREASAEIRRYISNPKEPIKTFRVMTQLLNFESLGKKMNEAKDTGLRNGEAFGISNIGDIEPLFPAGREGATVEATKVLWATNGAMFCSPFYHYLLSMRGFLVWSLNWYPNISTEEEAMAYAEKIQEALKSAVD
ncbi:uncharacterized protein LOC106156892 [Lingula anatina]|uniref:Uncharacterized protein LOC106156892 n=1 Tax=Lingula anatina TaxID=7574 RepID=A0A1S3HP15_LINAN|nr:uncharacterized protein LOC106156892 [Lingula anatina]|eukprot:XP_013387787.1 uncharacterized protein LOC106156892 [Lingula anatina]